MNVVKPSSLTSTSRVDIREIFVRTGCLKRLYPLLKCPFPFWSNISIVLHICTCFFSPPDMPHTVYCIHVLTIQTVSLALLYVLVCDSLHAFVLLFFFNHLRLRYELFLKITVLFFLGGRDGLIFIEVEVNAWWLIRYISKQLW